MKPSKLNRIISRPKYNLCFITTSQGLVQPNIEFNERQYFLQK